MQSGDEVLGAREPRNGWIRRVRVDLEPPRLGDNRGDTDRLLQGLKKVLNAEQISIGLPLVRKTPSLLRSENYRATALLHQESKGSWHLFDLTGASPMGNPLGVAVDLGSTTLALRLVDLWSGETRDEVSIVNPQVRIGPDILTRIHHAGRGGGLADLQGMVVEALNREVGSLAQRHGILPEEIAGMALAGNTTMTHLFLGLDPYWICREPYIPVVNSPPLLKAAETGMRIHPEAPVLVLPNVGSYFGGDLIGGILASGMAESEDLSILVDIGTNAEIVLGNRDWLVACAGAAGPALEGGVAEMGMMAGPGVIDQVKIDPSTGGILVRTIGNTAPVGICGSGLIDLAAELYLAGMIDDRGKFVLEKCGSNLRESDGNMNFMLVPAQDSGSGQDLTIAQTDVDGLLRSKAAMFTILTTVTNMVNVSMKDIRRFFISGTFGTYIDPRSAITIGMVPDLPLETYIPLGNTSLAGATAVLLSLKSRDEIYRIRDGITYVELNVNQEFMNLFSAAKFIPHTDRTLFPSVNPRR